MRVQILTNLEHFDFVLGATRKYEPEHDIRISTQPYVILDEYDVGISFMHQYRVLPEHVNTHTWINFHPAPLPKYKGRNLCYHAIMNGEKEFGATIHYMDENFDTGDIIGVERFPIFPHYTAEDLSERAIDVSKFLFKIYFPHILDGEDFLRYPNGKGTYYKKSKIIDTASLDKDVPLSRFIRAVTYKDFYPKLEIGGVVYKVVRDD